MTEMRQGADSTRDQPSAGAAAAIIEAQFPALAPARVRHLGEGCDSTAFEVNGAWVFRFPKRTDVEPQLRLEARVLPSLLNDAPVAVPRFECHGQPTTAFPRDFVGYRKLPGVTGLQLDPGLVPFDRLAPQIGRFLSWLHRVSVEEALSLGVEPFDLGSAIAEWQAEAIEGLTHVGQVKPHAPLERWRSWLAAGPGARPATAPAVFLHNDLAADHVLIDVDTATVTGIIDWSDMAVGDRAVDFGGLFHWGGEAFVRAVLEGYDHPIDDSLLPDARFLAACRGVADVTFGVETDRPEYIAGGLRALELSIPDA